MFEVSALLTIAKELRSFASKGQGSPRTVRMQSKTLLNYAEALEQIHFVVDVHGSEPNKK